jgi:hypothetical protein
MTISPRTLLLIALAAAVGLAAYVASGRSTDATPTAAVAAPPAASKPARQAPEVPFGSVAGSTPGTKLTLLSLRRTGPKVVTARLRVSYYHEDTRYWLPTLDGHPSAEDMRLVDEVNGREHFVLRNGDGRCLCSGAFTELESGESSVVSAKFPAPPADVTHASLETPGFASFDAVPLS